MQAQVAGVECYDQILTEAQRTMLKNLSYAHADPVQLQVGDKLRFFLMEPLVEGSFFKLNTNLHDGKGFRHVGS